MTKRNKILVVVDDDSEDLPSLARAVQIAEAYDADLELFSVAFDPSITAQRLFGSTDLLPAKRRLLSETVRRLLDIASAIRDEGVSVGVDAVWDTPVHEGIVRKVLSGRYCMVIRNFHRHTKIDETVFSNDDWNLIRTCPVPLLITKQLRSHDRRLRIMAAVDPLHENAKPSGLDDVIIDSAKMMSEKLEGELHLVHCWDAAPIIAATGAGTMLPVITNVREISQQVQQQHASAMHALADKHVFDRERVALIEGPARKGLPAFAIEKRVDIAVLGAVSRSFLKRIMLGHTVEYILSRMPCDVLVVKPLDFETSVNTDCPHGVALESNSAEMSARFE